MMSSHQRLVIYDPVGQAAHTIVPMRQETLQTVNGKSVGFLFNQHSSSTNFWSHLERAIHNLYKPSRVTMCYKPNTWAQAPTDMLENVTQSSDYAVVGVGA